MRSSIEHQGKSVLIEETETTGKALSLTVKPNQKVILRIPPGTSEEKKIDFVRRKSAWVKKQLQYFQRHKKTSYRKEYISGESFWYLGRQYKLIVKQREKDGVEFDKYTLYICTSKPTSEAIHNKRIVDSWLRRQRRIVFTERFEECKKRFDYSVFPYFTIKFMEKRWGSFIDVHSIVLNPKLIHVSVECIDYVIVHELCHVRYKNHSKYFFEYLSRKCPSWKKVKEKLEMSTIE